VPARVQFYFRARSRPEAQQCGFSFPTAMPRRMHTLSKVEAWAEVKLVRAIATMAIDGWDPVPLRREQLDDPDVGPILQEVETGHRQPQPHIQKLLGPMEIPHGEGWRHWECANRRVKIAQIVLPPSRVNDVLAKLHGRPSGGHLGVNKTLRQRYCWLQTKSDVEKWCRRCDACIAIRGP
jgi:hypothetical protein